MAGPLTREQYETAVARGILPPDENYALATGLLSADDAGAPLSGAPERPVMGGPPPASFNPPTVDNYPGRPRMAGEGMPEQSLADRAGDAIGRGLRATWDSEPVRNNRRMAFAGLAYGSPAAAYGRTLFGLSPAPTTEEGRASGFLPPLPAAPAPLPGKPVGDKEDDMAGDPTPPPGLFAAGGAGRAVFDPGGLKYEGADIRTEYGIPASKKTREEREAAVRDARRAAKIAAVAADESSGAEREARERYIEEARAAEAQREANEQRRQAELERLRAKREAALEEANSPGAVVGKAVGGLFASLGVALGAYAATMTGQRNHALDAFNAFTEAELKRQKMAADREDNYYSRMRAEFGDARTAEDMTRAAIHRAASMELEKLGAKAKGDFAKAKYAETLAVLHEREADFDNRLTLQEADKVSRGDMIRRHDPRLVAMVGGYGPPIILGEGKGAEAPGEGQRPESPEEPPSNEEFWARRQAANDAANEETFARFRKRPVWDGEKFVNSEPDKPAAKPGAARGPAPVFAAPRREPPGSQGMAGTAQAAPLPPLTTKEQAELDQAIPGGDSSKAPVIHKMMFLTRLEQVMNLRPEAANHSVPAYKAAVWDKLGYGAKSAATAAADNGYTVGGYSFTREDIEVLNMFDAVNAMYVAEGGGKTITKDEERILKGSLGSYSPRLLASTLRNRLAPQWMADWNNFMSRRSPRVQAEILKNTGLKYYRYKVAPDKRLGQDFHR